MPTNAPQRTPDSLNRPRRSRAMTRLIPLLMLLGFAALVSYREVPVVRDTVLRYLEPQAVGALEVCRKAAVKQGQNPEFARLIEHGEAHATAAGYFVDRVVVGEMVAGRGEVRFAVTCHVDATGNLAQVHREERPAELPTEEVSSPRAGPPGK
ncbi:MAG: hypothetical protein ACFCUG_10935 [Thiotrichales bacterium]